MTLYIYTTIYQLKRLMYLSFYYLTENSIQLYRQLPKRIQLGNRYTWGHIYNRNAYVRRKGLQPQFFFKVQIY